MTTTPERFEDRPSRLSLVHVRMPPGCAPSSRPERPFMVHAAYYRQGNTILDLQCTYVTSNKRDVLSVGFHEEIFATTTVIDKSKIVIYKYICVFHSKRELSI